jgi:archaellum component FlaC
MIEDAAERLPDLQKIEAALAEVEGEISTCQARMSGLHSKLQEVHDEDLTRQARAANLGRTPQPPRAPKLREQLEDTQGELELLQRRYELLTSDRSTYVSSHRDEILATLEAVRNEHAQEVREGAEQALEHLLRIFECEDDAREIGRLAPVQEPAIPYTEEMGVTNLWGSTLTRQSISSASSPTSRGNLQETLTYLQSLAGPDEETVVGPSEAHGEDDEQRSSA